MKILLAFTMLLLSFCSLSAKNKYISMRIFSRDIGITTISRISCIDMISNRGLKAYETSVKDRNILYKVETLLQQCIFSENRSGDAKIVCLLQSSSGVDTLSFYNGDVIIFNGKKGDINIRLLDLISSFLPPEQQKSVEELLLYLDKNPKDERNKRMQERIRKTVSATDSLRRADSLKSYKEK